MTNIGVFDSGLGGLTVLKRLIKDHKANYFYVGDNKRIPYGAKTKEEIVKFSKEIVKFLEKFDIDFYVIACNTISANAKEELEESFKKEFVSIVQMGIQSALEKDGDIYLLATNATVDTHIYKKEIEAKSLKNVTEIKAPKLVDLLEKAITKGEMIDKALREYLEIANKNKIENIILGCTHYPIIKDEIEKNLSYNANIINPAEYLSKNLKIKEKNETSLRVFMTDVNPITQKMTNFIMNDDIRIEKAIL